MAVAGLAMVAVTLVMLALLGGLVCCPTDLEVVVVPGDDLLGPLGCAFTLVTCFV